MKARIRAGLRRHRWNVAIAVGLVIGLWIAPYVYWRQQAIMVSTKGWTSRLVPLPEPVNQWGPSFFGPLAHLDGLITGDTVTFSNRALWEIQ